jgi:1-deoxy-D-xylulose-5-phosphate synthase
MRNIPNMIVAAPMDEIELRNMLYTAQLKEHGPFSIRYPRGRGAIADWKKPFEEIPVGKGRMITDGNDLAVLTIGNTGILAAQAIKELSKENYSIAHFDMRFVKPLDEELLDKVFSKFKYVLTIEDGVLKGGFGSAVLEFMCDNVYASTVKRLGIPDRFIDQGTQQELYKECGFDVEGIVKEVKALVKKRVLSRVS